MKRTRRADSYHAEHWWDDLLTGERTPPEEVSSGGVAALEPTRVAPPNIKTARKAGARILRRFRSHDDGLTQKQRKDRRRRIAVLFITGVVLLIGTASSVGVIMLNNLVIKRSAELGRLETERRTLRTSNALMGAEIAKLSAPPRITQTARKKLGMVHPPQVAKFIYIDDAHKPVTDAWRKRKAEQAQNQVRVEQAAAAAAISGTTSPGVATGAVE
jgi:cell division protein FtsL